jgi:uncharacterized protein (DUF362 family)
LKVYLRDCPSYQPALLGRMVREIFADAGLAARGAVVLVKPSFVYPARAPDSLAVSTQPQLVAAVVEALRDRGARRVVVAEDSLLGPSEVAFQAMGLRRHLGPGAELLPLQRAPRVSVDVADPLIEERFVVPAIWRDADLFVSLPKIKVNMYADVTLSVKNNFGFLLQEHRLRHHHYDLHKKIADLYKVRPPDFVVVDSVVAGQGQGPMAAEPVWMKVLLAGANGLAVDAVACHLMGFEPGEVEHLRHLAAAGLGPIDLGAIELENPQLLAERRRVLRRPRTDFADLVGPIRVVTGSEVCCAAGCAGMLRNSLDQWQAHGRLGELAGYTFVVGKPIADLGPVDRRRTIVVGDCAREHAAAGTFVPGCSVAPLGVVKALARQGKLVPMRTRYRDILAGIAQRWLRRGP